MTEADADSWSARRRRAVEAHAAEHDRRRATESARAAELVARFAEQARERGLPAVPLAATAYDGRATYRTALRGWYLLPDRGLAVGTDGAFYILTVPASLRARLFGATVAPAQPRLIVGEGGRDGESTPLEALLRRRLTTAWPPG